MSRRVERDFAIERRAGIGGQRTPARQRGLPVAPGGRVRATGQILERGVVRSDHAGARAGLDRHVADGEAAFHRQARDRRARILDDVARGARRADPRDDREHDVLGANAVAEPAVDRDPHRLRLALPQRLRREDVGHLRRSDAERERAERAVRRRVAVAAHDDRAGPAQALLGADDVHDALARIGEAQAGDAGGGAVRRSAPAPCRAFPDRRSSRSRGSSVGT